MEGSSLRINHITLDHAKATMTMVRRARGVKSVNGCMIPNVGNAGKYKQVQVQEFAVNAVRSRGRQSRQTRPYFPSGMKSFRVLVHQLAYLEAKGVVPEAGFDISHLCHQHECCNPDHLIIEPHSINISRIGCPGTLIGKIPCYHSDCNSRHDGSIILCRHVPPCMSLTRL